MADLSLDSYWQLPPLSRTVATAAFAISICVHLGLLPGFWFIFHPSLVFSFKPQLWRFVTAFLITGPSLGLLFDTYFVYSYLSQLESGNPRFPRKEDLIWYLMFVGGTIMCISSTAITVPGNEEDYLCTSVQPIIRNSGLSEVQAWWDVLWMARVILDSLGWFFKLPTFMATCIINYLADFGFVTFLQALVLAMCYTVTQDQRGAKVNYMFITIPAQLTPYAMLLFNLLFPGGVSNMMLQAQGLVAAHMYDFLTRIWPEYGGGRNLIPTPPIVASLVRGAGQAMGTASARVSGQASSTGTSTGLSRGPLPESWRTRGPGHRLG